MYALRLAAAPGGAGGGGEAALCALARALPEAPEGEELRAWAQGAPRAELRAALAAIERQLLPELGALDARGGDVEALRAAMAAVGGGGQAE